MIPLRNDISKCDHCGVCCQRSPCLLGSPREVKRISRVVGFDIRKGLIAEKTPEGNWQVRISAPGKPCRFFDGRCMIQTVKPRGGREFECWTPATFDKTYFWTEQQLAEV